MRIIPASICSLLLASALGCVTPAPVVRLVPNSANVVWASGRAVVAQEQTGVRVATAFDHQTSNAIAFRIEIQNDTQERLEVNPREIAFVKCTDAATCSHSYRVGDPEEALTALDQQRAQEEAAAANSAMLGASMVMLSAVGDVATVASGRTTSDTGLRTAALGAQASANGASHDHALSSIEGQRAQWSNDALRRTSLFPGRGVAGYVYVPIDTASKFVWLQVRTSGRRFSFCFQQQVVNPPSSQPAVERIRR